MNRFEEDVVFGKPFGAVFLGVQWKDGVLQQGWSEKVEQKTKSGRYLGTINRERWEDVPGEPAAEVGGQKSEVGGDPPLATMNWPCMIRAYATQMTHPDTAIKHEVIRHLHDQIGECLNAWEAEILNR